MADDKLKYIYLQPECCAEFGVGRLWCEDPDPEDCEDGKSWEKYIRFEEYEKLLLKMER